MSFWTRRECARRVKNVFINFGRVQNERTLSGSVKNTGRLDKTWQPHQRIRIRLITRARYVGYNRKKIRHSMNACLYQYNYTQYTSL